MRSNTSKTMALICGAIFFAACAPKKLPQADTSAAPAPTAVESKEASALKTNKATDGTITDSGAANKDQELTFEQLDAKPLYQFTPEEVDRYLGYLHEKEPDLRKRIAMIGRKNINQPYELYLLGEFPYETYDSQPMFCLEKSDCVVFSEHTYAMALSKDWPTFFAMLQRIRYHNGEVGVASRNHYTEADWDKNNSWLVHDITTELKGATPAEFTQKIDRKKFLKNRYKIDREIPVEVFHDKFIPWNQVAAIESQLQEGDFVNVMRGSTPEGAYAGHVGLIVKGEDGKVHFLHSTPPQVREQPLDDYIQKATANDGTKKPGDTRLLGFKFLRLQDDPVANLKKIDGSDAPRVTPPSLSKVAAAGN